MWANGRVFHDIQVRIWVDMGGTGIVCRAIAEQARTQVESAGLLLTPHNTNGVARICVRGAMFLWAQEHHRYR